MQLTPARRLFYGLGVAGFLVGLFEVDLLYMLVSFIILKLHSFVKSEKLQDDATMVAIKMKAG